MRKTPLSAVLAVALLAGSARADVAPPKHLKRVTAMLVFSGVSNAKGYTLVLLEPVGPGAPNCAVLADGKPIGQLAYRWLSPRVVAIKGAVASVDKARCAELAKDKSLPKSEVVYPTTTVNKSNPAVTVHTKLAITGVAGTKVTLTKAGDDHLDAQGKVVPASKRKASSCAVGGRGSAQLGVVLLLLLALALAAWRTRARVAR
ncbi:MAG: hypothetical protein KC503_43270 [Myxococcales bacterium]|nr:hypothetical protein [Myxococcales bacterium]